MSLFGRLFRRPPAPPVDRRAGCGSWRRGELAVCIYDRWDAHGGALDPRRGEVLRVSAVMDATNHCGIRAIWLFFDGKPAQIGWIAAGFRKVARDDRAASADFTRRIRRLGRAPVRAKEPV